MSLISRIGHRLPLQRARAAGHSLTSSYYYGLQAPSVSVGSGGFNINTGKYHCHHQINSGFQWGNHVRSFSSTTIPFKNEHQRHKLHIGFASLSNSLPFESPPEEPDTSTSKKLLVGDTELDPRATIMLTALRGSVSSFDCPAPPLIESNKVLPNSGADCTTCWNANRQSEVQMAQAFDQAWDALLEEDDDEALRALRGESNVVNIVHEDDDDSKNNHGACVTMTCRLGYRAAVVLSEDEVKDAMDNPDGNTDCQEREDKFEGDTRVGMLYTGKPAEEGDSGEVTTAAQPAVVLVHNMSQEYVLHSLRTSPLVQQYKLNNESSNDDDDDDDDGTPQKKVNLISLAHNPETQIAAYLLSNHGQTSSDNSTLLGQAHAYMKQSLTSTFVGYEIAVKEGLIDGYGVDSNGLSLPNTHDMNFGWRDILECAADAYLEVHGHDVHVETGSVSSLKVIRLPGNILETRGLLVADEIRTFFGKCEDGQHTPSDEGLPSFTSDQSDKTVQQKQRLRKLRKLLPKSLEVYVTRPLTAYPYGGTGWGPNSSPGLAENSGTPPLFLRGQPGTTESSGDGKNVDATHPIRILDYKIEAGSGQDASLIWSNHHYNQLGGRPASYQPILNAALSHFDGDAILEASRERELTVEERETLDGCKLLRDMIHDLDASLDTIQSFAAYEEYLVNTAVPLIYGTFEELDEESTQYLQLFFRVHGMAVRLAVGRWTRDLLLAGWKRAVSNPNLTDVDGEDSNRKRDTDVDEQIAKIWESFGFGEFSGGYDFPEDVTLQGFALKQLLKDDAVKGLVVGCSQPEHVLEAVRAADSAGGDKKET